MPIDYPNETLLHRDDFTDFSRWHHEGIGRLEPVPGANGMRLHCDGSAQGKEACMAFFRPDLPDPVVIEYDLMVHSQGGLIINYFALRGLNGEDVIADRDKLPPRTGIMANYFSTRWKLQSYHVSFSRFDDRGVHTGTSNWRRNPGGLLVGHGNDPVMEIGRRYHLRFTKDRGHLQSYVDGIYAHGVMDRDTSQYPIPDTGKFGFRLIGSNVKADISAFRVFQTTPQDALWKPWP
ncbi:MAG: hypothetical protein A2498_07855 [Lentisphaerae bacterium RIFOXYC12_FULL_60_16]|nr:MAG: hypothetical protein A2498_07855 [Lentisphaerae bacterium RIFOXYC12_FULL_60_16]OGV68869.1 MAG: hypothetical protein A2269_03400 [Lentisphaerae bacterium RIFOXYA12_FULL_60_10]